MPSVTYMNQSAPFWDFIASLEQQGSQNRNNQTGNEPQRGEDYQGPHEPFSPWGWGHQFFGGGRGMPHRGGPPHGPRRHQHEEAATEQNTSKNVDKDEEMHDKHDNGEGPSCNSGPEHDSRRGDHDRWGAGRRDRCGPDARGFGPRHGAGPRHGGGSRHGHHDEHDGSESSSSDSGSDHEGRRGNHDHCGGGRRRRCGPGARGFGPRHGAGPRHGHQHGSRRGGWGPWTRGGPFGGMNDGPFGLGGNSFDPSTLATLLWNQFTDTHPSNNAARAANPTESADHSLDADIFDTESSYVVHVSLPGAKKEDVGVNWDAEKSALSIAGVIYRPGDEDFLKTLAMNERKVGPFERNIHLGTRATPANVDADGITAKLEDGVLRVNVPKLDAGYVEIKKVDIE